MPDDPSAIVADLRSRHYSTTLAIGEPVSYSGQHKWPCHADGALRAVEAVLKLHVRRSSRT